MDRKLDRKIYLYTIYVHRYKMFVLINWREIVLEFLLGKNMVHSKLNLITGVVSTI